MKDRLARTLELIDANNESATMSEIFQRLCDGETIGAICRSKDISEGRILEWIRADETRKARFMDSLEIATVVQVHEGLDIIDSAVPILDNGGMDSAAVSDKKARADFRLKIAKHHNRTMYGDVRKVEHSLGGDFGERLRRARERVVSGGVTDVAVIENHAVESKPAVKNIEREWL